MLRSLAKKILPYRVYRKIRENIVKRLNKQYFSQGYVYLKHGNYELRVPEQHSLSKGSPGFAMIRQSYIPLCIRFQPSID
jgi:hypothetical protein